MSELNMAYAQAVSDGARKEIARLNAEIERLKAELETMTVSRNDWADTCAGQADDIMKLKSELAEAKKSNVLPAQIRPPLILVDGEK